MGMKFSTYLPTFPHLYPLHYTILLPPPLHNPFQLGLIHTLTDIQF